MIVLKGYFIWLFLLSVWPRLGVLRGVTYNQLPSETEDKRRKHQRDTENSGTLSDDADTEGATQMFAWTQQRWRTCNTCARLTSSAVCRLRDRRWSWRTSTSPFCWRMKETGSWRCCRRMRNYGNERRRGYGEHQSSWFWFVFRSFFSLSLRAFCFSPTGSWRTSCWRSNGKVRVRPGCRGSDSALAALRLWAWSLTVESSARSASCVCATTAALRLPRGGSGDVTFVPRSRKCDDCRE